MQLLSKTLTLLLIAFIVWLGWQQLGPRKPEMGPLRQVLADEAVVAMAGDLQKHRDDARRAVLVHFVNDPSGYITGTLRRILEQRGTFDLEDRSFMAKLRDLLNMRQPAHAAPLKAGRQARATGVDVAIIGQVHEFESFAGGAKARIDYSLVSAGGTQIFKGRFLKTVSDARAAPAAPDSQSGPTWSNWLQKALFWALATLLLPVVTISFIRAMVRRNSNAANAFVLAIYTAISVIAAFLLLGTGLGGIWLALLLLGAGALALAYTIRITTLAVRLEE